MDRHVGTPNPHETIVTCLAPAAVVPVAAPLEPRLGLPSESAACHFPVAESGRELRALVASLLL